MDLTLKTDAEVESMFRKFTILFSRKKFLTELPDKGIRIEQTLLLAKKEIDRRRRDRQCSESESNKVKADPSNAEGSQLKENWMYNKMEACSQKKFDRLQSFERKPQIKFRENLNATHQPKKQPVAKIEAGLEAAAKDEPSQKRMKSGKGQEDHSPRVLNRLPKNKGKISPSIKKTVLEGQENKPENSIKLDEGELVTKKIIVKLAGTDPIVLHYNQKM